MSASRLLETKPPALSTSDAERPAAEVFGLEAAPRPLESERDQNFLFQTGDARAFVLKIASRCCRARPRRGNDGGGSGVPQARPSG